ncbi:MAG: phosphate propanoyltransferase [Elusimicrobiota bacterium]
MDNSKIIGEVLLRLERSKKPVVCNVSNRHVHLKKEDVEKLFGQSYTLRKLRDLMQPGEYAAHETVDIAGPKSMIKRVRVLGPSRRASQVEISKTDCYKLGIKAPVRISGNIAGTPGCRMIGPAGSIELAEGVIVSQRHVHMAPQDASCFKVTDGQTVRIRTRPPRSVIFEDVAVRVSDGYCLEFHVDTDEANACDLVNGEEVFLS